MKCPKCGGTVGYSKAIETSAEIELKGLALDVAENEFIDAGKFFYESGVEILCSKCNEETIMEEEVRE